MEGRLLLKVRVLHARGCYLGYGLLHIDFVLKSIAHRDHLSQESETLLTLVDGRMLDCLTQELLGVVHELYVWMIWRSAQAEKPIKDSVGGLDYVTIVFVVDKKGRNRLNTALFQADVEVASQV